jgi:hypothetical protein
MNNTNVVIKLTKRPVRLSYPNLFTAKAGPDGGKPTYSAVFLLDKKQNAEDIRAIQAGIAQIVKEGLKGKHPGPDRICLRDGSAKPDTEGYGPGVMFISARNEKRPGVVDQQLTPLTAEDGKPYAGCYVYATVRLWAQDNQFGRRVNASLRNVQFVRDGEPFGEKPVLPEEDFVAVDESLL